MDELGSFTLIGFSDVSVVYTMVFRASRYCPVHPEFVVGLFLCGFGRVQVLL